MKAGNIYIWEYYKYTHSICSRDILAMVIHCLLNTSSFNVHDRELSYVKIIGHTRWKKLLQ